MIIRVLGYTSLVIISSFILGVSGLLCYWLADRHVPVDVLRTEIITPVVKPGGKLIIRQTIR